MTLIGWLQAIAFFALVTLCVKPLGTYMARVFEGESVWLSPVVRPIERGFYRLCGVKADKEMTWQNYAFAILSFSMVGFIYLYALLRTQAWLPLNPQHFPNMAPDLAWNTAISFLTNTNWQFYSGESALSPLVQMAGLGWHMFVSAGAGIAVGIAVMRGLTRSGAATLGNFWVDLTRSVLYVLLPLAIVGALALVWQGVPQNFRPYDVATTIEHVKQTIPQGPMASQEMIKELGTNGGGYVNANSAAPFENPTPLSNLIEMWAIFAISAA
jgi:K+-transporting ATPase ATPase A chain